MLFKEIDFGPDDAKGDVRLADYFVPIPEYQKVRSGEATFVIGRKVFRLGALKQIQARAVSSLTPAIVKLVKIASL